MRPKHLVSIVLIAVVLVMLMKNNNSKKICEGLISRTKIYLVLIAILLVVICVLDLRYFTPSVVLYILILAYCK